MLKRSFDITLSLIGLILLTPFFLAIAIFIKLDSKGPVFFRQTRIGKGGKPFRMFKFRTMVDAGHWVGPLLSRQSDPRVTTIGAILRRLKLNEFPQLINVLRGEMSFVGPRPEVPEFVKLYTKEQQRILCVRPGIVGPSQIRMRNEEELYPEGVDPQVYYSRHILPMKLGVDLSYVDNRSFVKDVGYLFQGIWTTITGAITGRHLFSNSEQIALFFCDIFICGLSYSLAYFLRFDDEFSRLHKTVVAHTLPYVVVTRMGALAYFGLYSSIVQYFSFNDVIKVIKGVCFSSALVILLAFLVGERSHPRSVFAIDWFIVMFLLVGYRVSLRTLRERLNQREREVEEKVLIYGAGDTGDLALRYLRMQGMLDVVAFVDDDPKKLRKTFKGIKVLGNRNDIEALVRLHHVDHVLIAMDDLNHESLEQAKILCKKAGVSYEVFALTNGGTRG
ncbi:MAG: sugar transferase [Thermodesulfobacteriota bacterium]|nr:sugar transferase [Thermodesulfobacteriota bacterium]